VIVSPAALAHAQQRAAAVGARLLKIDACVVDLIDDIDVPARETGPLVDLSVKEGAAVAHGELLGKIDDQVAQRKLDETTAKLRAAEKKANSTVEIDYAQATFEVANQEYEINRSLRAKGSISMSEYQKSYLAKQQAELSIVKAKNDLEIERLNAEAQSVELNAVNDAITRHQITSPLDGNVLKLYRQPGEWVQAGDKVLQIVRMNRLQVQGFIEATNFDPHEIDGRKVIARAKLARDRTEDFFGVVVNVGLQMRGDRRYAIVAEVDNRTENDRWLLIPGSEVDLTIDLASPAVAKSPPVTESR
jgi:macrolide-specific efflux system membrane fusion protein